VFLMRFDLRAPGKSAEQRADLYDAAIEMAAWAEDKGCASVVVSEHHASEDGYIPSPYVLAAAIAAVTTSVPINVAAAILPLYDPVRLAEDIITLDHVSRGRVMHTLAIGYRPVEYELHGVDFTRRGAIADEKLAILLSHLRGTAAGPKMTPEPFTPGGPTICVGGGTPPAARRAGRHGVGFIAQGGGPELEAAYNAAAAEAGLDPVFCMVPSPDNPQSIMVNDDVDAGWAEVGESLLADAMPYFAWNQEAGLAAGTVSLTEATTVDELRAANGSHRVVTVAEAVELIRTYGMLGVQPLCGGLDPDIAWTYLRRLVDEVLPAAAAPAPA
jgi:alkanesulfonate monooxygenase SsuD/methylene tetrahydromethanopterin reductase-like flavin-dependent oxidoreductase (luciferase family)